MSRHRVCRFRFGDRSQVNSVPRDAAVDAIVDWITRRENATPNAELFRGDRERRLRATTQRHA